VPDDMYRPFGDPARRSPNGGHNGTNGSHPAGLRVHPVAFDDLTEPVDLVAVQADDELINALAAGMSVSAPGVGGYDADDRVAAILAAWKADVDAHPIPELVDLDTAVSTVVAARPRSGRARHLVPVAAAAAFLVLAIGGVSVTSYNAQPDDALWGISKVLYAERAESVEAAARVEEHIANAKHALAAGQPVLAARELARAEEDLAVVRPQEGQGELAEAQDFLADKAAETPQGQPVNPASPLATQPSREVPESVREPAPTSPEGATSASDTPAPTATSEGQPGPEVARAPGDPSTPQETRNPQPVRPGPEDARTAPTSSPAPAPGPGNGEGEPDDPTGSNPPATSEGGPASTTSPAPAPPQDVGEGEAPDPGSSGPSASGDEPPAASN
jgi:Anti-sigma-D factor RsdA to sigma factor binding region